MEIAPHHGLKCPWQHDKSGDNRTCRIALFNDTGRASHVGCYGVSSGHNRMLHRAGVDVAYRSYLGEWCDLWQGDISKSKSAFWNSKLPSHLQDVDAVVVNGEGTIHHGHGLHLLTILAGAQELGLPTFLVNAVFQECEHDLNTLCRLDDLTVRDNRSSAYLKRLRVPHRVVLDSILEAEFADTPTEDLTDKVVITDWHHTRERDVGVALKQLLLEFGSDALFYPLESPACRKGWGHSVANLRTARLVVTARHHGVYLAALAGVPFVALPSNTWKVEGLLDLLPGNLRVCTDLEALRSICDEVAAERALFESVREFLISQCPLTTFQGLSHLQSGRRGGTRVAQLLLGNPESAEPELATRITSFFGSHTVMQLDWISEGTIRAVVYRSGNVHQAPRIVSTAPLNPRLPFGDAAFDMVLNTGSMACLSDAAVPHWLRELHRVVRCSAIIRLSTPVGPERYRGSKGHDRTWWETRFFAAGFRKHPLSQQIVSYGGLEQESEPITLVFEKIPSEALARYPQLTLEAERDLHMDMLRESGRRSDAHIARYMLARDFLPKEGIVLDAACGLGYGSAVIAQIAGPAVRVVGVDLSEFAIEYARRNFTPYLPNTEFHTSDVTDLSRFQNASVDAVVSFETIEHLQSPELFLDEIKRVLKPGGRILCSVPNLWVDETGDDPNPWHFHVFDFAKLAELCGKHFDLTGAYLQTAGGGMKLPDAPRRLRPLNLPVTSGHQDAEWWLVSAEKACAHDPELLLRARGKSIVVMTGDEKHPLYRSWMERCPFELTIWNPYKGHEEHEIPSDALLLITHDTYTEPGRTWIRKAMAADIPTLILADGILEYRNTWEHPQLEPGAIFQPVLGHKIATIGKSQTRWLESWGNFGKCETVGLPRMDRLYSARRRKRGNQEPFRFLVNTAITPFFTEAQRDRVLCSLLDMKRFFDEQPLIGGIPLEPVWRLTKGIAHDVGVHSEVTDLSGCELATVLQQVDGVVTTPSTVIVESMFLGLPVAVLDYCNSPHYVPTAWRITALEHMAPTLEEICHPPEPKMLFQETILHDQLECLSPAAPRMLNLVAEMVECGLRARKHRQPLRFPPRILVPEAVNVVENRFCMERLYPARRARQIENYSCPVKQFHIQEKSRNGENVRISSTIPQLIDRGISAAEQGHDTLAELMFEEVLELDPQHREAAQHLQGLRNRQSSSKPAQV
jgi:SAM-dependent methyltransferase